MLETAVYECPYCGEQVETTVDLSGGDQTYIEDCQVCCRPITFVLQVHGEEWHLEVFSEND
ncbi:CPXCG motif-containing cysteine-rich protein [Pseudomonas sp. PCH199]|uniref:CPXCG motif-containing cysteine-rich protein n=1 Tax=unclassified Pseudomonas TaxID=196821 RepID=UPI000BCD4908|nr:MULTISPECIES: CPXCG motif-containing cysteine-rich protein [unclassified Pseudomonas]MCW8275702.1 CPXCG motif-containing cysteine-rich protein [Pseudomonas sp. PCH199]PAM83784.1 CPXCG motif-containing cysteine-rich protein [Pseudomonas sp. ERMR1:02]